jgi:hypothetical protein
VNSTAFKDPRSSFNEMMEKALRAKITAAQLVRSDTVTPTTYRRDP